MQSIPIKTPWKKPERIFFRQFKVGEPYYGINCTYTPEEGDQSSYIQVKAHCTDWFAVTYLGIDEHDEPAYYTVLGWRGFLDKEDAANHLRKYQKSRKASGLENVPPYHTPEEFQEALEAHAAARASQNG